MLDRESPGRGFRHIITKRDVQQFIDLIPDWPRLSERLERIVLAASGDGCDGLYVFYDQEDSGEIELKAWPEDLWMEIGLPYFTAHRNHFERLGVSYDLHEDSATCRFTESQARAFMLLHVFLHELGHHFDRTTQKHFGTSKGEDYAEHFANSRFEQLLPAYERVFGHPARC